MASSSLSSSSCLSTSHSKYDVFLSFRGEDTRENFTSHLFAALCQKKIKTFIDEELKRGEQISHAILNAIEGSKISIIIFSRDYASSRWCLDELVKILECKKMNGQIVIPVFYHVHPGDVRKQIGSYGKAFVEHENRFKKMPEKVKKWRDALTESSYLSGHESMKIRPEAKLVNGIVKDVLKKLEDTTFSSDSIGLIGINSRIEKVKVLLSIGLSDFRIVGIWGMGGIGKTTIAGALFNLMSSEFEGKCFMANVREESERVGLLHLREQMLSEVLEENLKIGTPQLPGYIKERLRQMKVLIFLDDVNKFGQLEYLAGGLDGFGPGSRIIVTTRDKRVLDKYGVDKIYEVEGFTYHEALELFCDFAFKKNHHSQDLTPMSTLVVNYAKGNPLALKVLGSSLYKKSKQDWENALHNLKQISDPDIHDVLKISYDELNWEEKNLFLDIACFFKGEDKDYVTTVIEDCYSVHYGLSVLVDKSLITISRNVLQMHDLLQEIGQKIVQEESKKEPGKRSRLWYHEDIYHVLKKNKGTDSIEGIFLDMSKIRDIHLSPGAFANMPNLRFLKFYMPWIPDVSKMSSKVHLPQGLEYLPDELRYLYWHGYPLKKLPSNFSPENLIVLSLPYSKVKQLWKGEKEAFKLKQIDLCHCQDLTRILDPLETPSLEEIYLSNRTNLPYTPSSIQNFNNLSILRLHGCKSLRSFSSNIHFRSPISLDFSYCVNLTEFPQISGNIKQLNLCRTAIKEVPSWIECLTELTELNMRQCTRLKSLSANIGKLKSLHMLNLDDCGRLESFPAVYETMECLEYVSLALTPIKMQLSPVENELLLTSFADLNNPTENWCYGCRGWLLAPLPGLSSLRRLNLSYRNIIEIPRNIGCLSSLQTLDLRGNNFESLPASIKEFSWLQELILSDCNMLQSLPELPLSLLWLEAKNCIRLQSLPELPSCLEELNASKLEMLSELSHRFAWPNITFTFTNCLNLNKNADKDSLADSQLRIQHMATTSLKLFYKKVIFSVATHLSITPEIMLLLLLLLLQVFDVPPQFSISLPGSRIPDWFSYQGSGSSITIQLPQRWCNRRFFGLALCVVVEFEEVFDADYCFGVRCEYRFKTNKFSETRNGNWICFLTSTSDHRVKDSLIYSDHVLLGFDPWLDVRIPDGELRTVALFHFSLLQNYHCYMETIGRVKCCGVCPLYANPYKTESNDFTEKFATTIEEECAKSRTFHNQCIYHDKLETSGSTGITGTSYEEEVEPNTKRICRGKTNAP